MNFIKVILLILLSATVAFAQEKTLRPNAMDEQYTPDKNSIFNSNQENNNSSSSSGSSSTATAENVIKFYPGLFARNTVALFYERFLSDGISAQAGLGFCYNKDRIQMLFSETYDFDLYENSNSSASFSDILNNSEFTSGPNIYTGLSLRFFRESYYSDASIYFEMDSRFYHHTLQIDNSSTYSSSYPFYDNAEVNVSNFNFNFNFGRVYYTDGKIPMSHELYMGMGFRTSTFDKFELKEVNVVENGFPTTKEMNVKTLDRDKYFTTVFLIGYAFGIGF
jgi:hypothetical protein